MVISGVTASGGNAGDFIVGNACSIGGAGSRRRAQLHCQSELQADGHWNRSTVVIINSNDPVTPSLNISLSGVGHRSTASVIAPTVTFPTIQLVNTTSAAQTVTLSNTGNIAYAITSIGVSGGNAADFTVNYPTCPIGGAGLAPNASCTIALTFRPMASGTRTTTLNIVTTANVAAVTVPVSGTGTQVNLSTVSLTFAPQVVNTTSATQYVTLTNTGPRGVGDTQQCGHGVNAADLSRRPRAEQAWRPAQAAASILASSRRPLVSGRRRYQLSPMMSAHQRRA